MQCHSEEVGTSDRLQEDEATETSSDKVPGVVYLSRIPPFMKPHKLRHLLAPYGSIGRLFLQPEEEYVRKMRKKFGGSKKKNFTEGWVEFLDKRVAKAVARTLNSMPIGGQKRNYYHDDLWNIKYLPKFKWGHLTEKIAYERAVRDQQKRTEVSQAKRENRHYRANVDKGKEISAILERKKRKGIPEREVPLRRYKQRLVQEDRRGKDKERSGQEARESKRHLSDSLLRKIIGT